MRRMALLGVVVITGLFTAGCSSSPVHPATSSNTSRTEFVVSDNRRNDKPHGSNVGRTARLGGLCGCLPNYYARWFGKGVFAGEEAAEGIDDAADIAQQDDPRAYGQLQTVIDSWLVDISSPHWIAHGQPDDAQTNAVSKECATLHSQGLVS